MDKYKIGQFISQCRRNLSITQEQLAEMLDVTSKSVSKWENGLALPAPALYEPLCAILGISINELFAGERITEADYKSVADKNLMQIIKYKLYCMSDKNITFYEFDHALTRIAELVETLKDFPSREHAISHMVKETHFSYDKCANAYDFYINLFTMTTIPEDMP